MKNKQRKLVCILFLLTLPGCQTTGGSKDTNYSESNSPVLDERLHNADVTEKRLNNGAVISEIKFAGSLKPNFDLDCIQITEVTSQFNPPALIHAAKKCIQQGQYDKAWALTNTANGFAYYDIKRLADRSTRGALTVLHRNVYSSIPKAQREGASKRYREIQADPMQIKAYCSEIKRIGPPTYEPLWAIRHGIGVYQEPKNGDYLANVDEAALWGEVTANRCKTKQ